MNNSTTTANSIHVHLPGLRIFIVFLCSILYLVGYTGCLLSIVTFSSKKLRRHSTGFLFLIMAFVDIFNLFASLRYFLDVIYQIDVLSLSIHWCRFFTIFDYEIYFGFSWIFVFISIDRWIKVEWPTKSQRICTRKRFVHLCCLVLILSLIQNLIYTFLCLNNECLQKNLICEVFIHVIYITIYMTVPIALILISISRTCLITLHIKKRFRSSNKQPLPPQSTCQPLITVPTNESDTKILNKPVVTPYRSNSFISTPSSTNVGVSQPTNHQIINYQNCLKNYSTYLRRRRTRLDTQMVILISINVAPFIIVHIITEIAYLFEKYSSAVRQSRGAQLFIILIYLSWYLISATRFYTNCLLSRIYREEFKNRLYMLRHGCKPRIILVGKAQSCQNSPKFYLGNTVDGIESVIIPTARLKSCDAT